MTGRCDQPLIGENNMIKAITAILLLQSLVWFFLRRGSPALCHGSYRQLYVDHEQICFLRQAGDERVVVMVNASDKPMRFQVEIPFEMGAEGFDLLNEQRIAVGSQQIICEVLPNWARVLRV